MTDQPPHLFPLAALGEILEREILLRATNMQQEKLIAEQRALIAELAPKPTEPAGPPAPESNGRPAEPVAAGP